VSPHSTVLLAHFDPAERERLARFLKEGEVEVAVAANAAQALELFQQKQPTLALVSCMLPGISGFDVCRQLRDAADIAAPLPVVLLSDAEDPYVRARARHVGAKRVLFGSVSSAQAKELLAVNWEGADTLELAARGAAAGQDDQLFRDLLAPGKTSSSESLMAKVTDPLTGLVNAEYLTLKLEEECKRSARYGQPLSLVLVEVKSFDQLVEKNGRAVGDEALLEVAGVLLCESRDVDVAGRVGPARFHLLLPNTPADGARIVARRIAENLRERRIVVDGKEIALEARMGLAIAERETARTGAGEFVRLAEHDLASAQLSPDGIGTFLRGEPPVEPLAEAGAKKAANGKKAGKKSRAT
jgi:two-component system chemotaxis family response regulator WspR